MNSKNQTPNQSVSMWRRIVPLALVILFILIGVIKIASTHTVFNHTHDEHQHIASGMNFLDHGTIRFDRLAVSLPRIAVAIGPYLTGIRSMGHEKRGPEGEAILNARGEYSKNLSLARMGIIPFFILASLLVWVWSRLLFGDIAAVVSTLLFTTQPTVLAHSGLATTDMAITATLLLALFVFTLWLESPNLIRSIALGFAVALAIWAKVSALVFIPVSAVMILGVYWWKCRRDADNDLPIPFRALFSGLFISMLFAAFLTWSSYGFSIDSMNEVVSNEVVSASPPYRPVNKLVGDEGLLHDVTYNLLAMKIPAPEFFVGFGSLMTSVKGRTSYLLGENRQGDGFISYFPIALAVKTTLPSLLFALVGFIVLVLRSRHSMSWQQLVPAAVIFPILLVVMPSSINIGVRHVLPIYGLLAIIAGMGVVNLWKLGKHRFVAPSLVILLLAWQLVSSAIAHPNYLAYFNEVASHEPERFLLSSNLDWGQDLKRLGETLHSRQIRKISTCLRGPSSYLKENESIIMHRLKPYEPTSGWIAVSVACLKQGTRQPPYDQFDWLNNYEPEAMIGNTIKLYYISETK